MLRSSINTLLRYTLLASSSIALCSLTAFSQQPTARTHAIVQALSKLEIFRDVSTKEVAHWVDSVYLSLDQRGRVAQLLMPIIYPRLEDQPLLEKRLQEEQWGGILFQKGLLAEQRALTIALQQVAQVPLLITLDGEWGLFMRLKDAPRYPRNKPLGDHNDLKLIEDYGAEVARQCRLMGIHVNFAPVVDVNSNPRNPVIGTRSFGNTPRQVAACALAYGRALERGGVLSVAKHFPGHGDTSEDSHKTLPTVSASRETMARQELYPFRQYQSAGLGGVMTAHLRVPAYDASGTPSSLSPAITSKLLRDELGFRGLVFTDALEMKGAQVAPGKSIAIQALLAGNDILLGLPQPKQALEEILQALEQGVVSTDLIEDRCKRILAFKYALIVKPGSVAEASAGQVKQRIWTPEEAKLRERLWQATGRTSQGADPTAKTPAMQRQGAKTRK